MGKCWFFLIILLQFIFSSSCWIVFPSRCNPGCIQIYQWPSGYASLHIPKFTVQIIIETSHVEGVYDVLIGCPAFATTTLINPVIFRRRDLATCILKNGGVIKPGEVITFEYSNILPYPFTLLDMKCL